MKGKKLRRFRKLSYLNSKALNLLNSKALNNLNLNSKPKL